MNSTAAECDISNEVSHYRLVGALAKQERACSSQSLVAPRSRHHVNLASVASAMNVPVVMATYYDENGIQTFATHGLGLMNNLALFAAACNDLCVDQAVVIPNTRTHQSLGALAKHWPAEDICFLVGIPLCNDQGQRVGSLTVMNTSKAVASRGISFRSLEALGKAIAQSSRLPSEPLAA